MTTFASKRAFWKKDAFWFVAMPTSLVALVFVLEMVTRILGG